MTEKEKQLLLKDLCMRIQYRTFVCLNPGAYNKPETCILTGIHGEKVHLNVDSDPFRINNIRPYLRPMSSMTEEEREEESGLWNEHDTNLIREMLDFYCSHHLDWNSLIPKGLALEAPKDMY